MAAFNAAAADVMRNVGITADHFERSAAATFIVPTTTPTLQLEPFTGVANNPHFVAAAAAAAAAANANTGVNTSQQHTHQTNSTSSSYTFVQIKREPCQVSEVTTSNNCHHHHHHQQLTTTQQQQQQHSSSMSSSSSKTTLTTLVKIEASSPKVHDLDKATLAVPSMANTNNSVPIGIAVARKRPQESATSISNATIPVQQTLNKDMNCFGIRVADIGGVSSGCGNFYFTGNGDLMTGSTAAEELALSAAGVQGVNRAPSSFWQYPSALPFESVISMSPATVGLQYQRDANRGQVVLLPATAAALDPFQQAAAAAAFVWPSYIPQGTATAALQPPPNFIFPSMSPHSSLQTSSYATPLQLFGSNYLTAAAAAAAAAAATSTFCQHNQQQSNNNNSNGINNGGSSSSGAGILNLGLGAMTAGNAHNNNNNNNAPSNMNNRFLSLATTDSSKRLQDMSQPKQQQQQQQQLPLILPPPTMKVEEWNATEFMGAAAAAKSTATTLSATSHQNNNHHHNQIGQPVTTLSFERDKPATATSLLDLHAAGNAQALNLIRLPTPTTPGSIEATASQLQPQILFQANATASPTLLNLSASNTSIIPRVGGGGVGHPTNSMTANFLHNVGTTATLGTTATIVGGPPTPLSEEALNFKATSLEAQQQFVVGVPRATTGEISVGPPPQMQDVNIQTDTPICSEDENSSCPHTIQSNIPASASMVSTPPPSEMDPHDEESEQPLELIKAGGGFDGEGEGGGVGVEELGGSMLATHSSTGEELQESNSAVQCHSNAIISKDDDTVGGECQRRNNIDDNYTPSQAENRLTILSEPTNVEVTPSNEPMAQTTPEDLTGLELLSNISTSSLAKGVIVPSLCVKMEPVEHAEYMSYTTNEQLSNSLEQKQHCDDDDDDDNNHVAENNMQLLSSQTTAPQPPAMPQSAPLVEALGGLNLLCALAEQRIQEEVQCSGSLFNANTNTTTTEADPLHFQQKQSFSPPCDLQHAANLADGMQREIVPTTTIAVTEAKRKKHKHSKSSKSSKKSSQRSGKKSKKKCSKEKRRNKHLTMATTSTAVVAATTIPAQKREMELEDDDDDDDDDDLKEDIKSAFDKVDSSYKRFGKWPNREEIFKAMESNMRMRLAEITRQYRKKKRKLDEISKNKKLKKKALKKSLLSASLNVAAAVTTSTSNGGSSSVLSCLGGISTINTCATTMSSSSSPLCDYKFSKLLTKPPSCTTPGSYLSPSNFLRFPDTKPQIQSQFPPANNDANLNDGLLLTPTCCSSSSLYKTLRLEPSALAASTADGGRSNTPLRLPKHATDKSAQQQQQLLLNTTHVKERKLAAARLCADTSEQAVPVSKKRSLQTINIDRELKLSSEHLYRKETRVLTDMGGLFYAGIMKPLQPPDVYAITLDGERGNKSHIMSREEIFKDTILEVSPKSIASVPVGTRLCAYWSQQYRCLYPGRATESEPSENNGTSNDFVSVEFDDGDSGRIRLQNIRFLLSAYPIVEYDNPLYSLGKQKRSTIKSDNNSEHTQLQESSSAAEDQQHQIINHNTEMQNKSMELFTQRSEQKRIKSLKKKSQATIIGGGGTNGGVSAGGVGNNGGNITNESNERLHKHHKHKKRKKHKKHHHRKALAAETEAGDANSSYTLNPAALFPSKREQPNVSESNLLLLRSDNERKEVNQEQQQQFYRTAESEKQILVSTVAVAANEETFKLKTENLDLEEESTSNMMSEISDEVEHNNNKGSKIAAFLPERQLWGWFGVAYRKAGVKGRARKQFYKTIKRGKETITVGDCAVFLSTGRPDRPYIGRIESMWETASSNKVVRVRWFYHPEETTGCPNLKYPGALFESPHEDENDVQTISHRCAVLPFERYFEKFGADSKQYQSIYDNNDTYYLSGYYNPRLQILKLQDDIPTLEEKTNPIDE